MCRIAAGVVVKGAHYFVKKVAAGEGVSYGQRHHFDKAATVATVPLGYADGVPRRLSAVGGEVWLGTSLPNRRSRHDGPADG